MHSRTTLPRLLTLMTAAFVLAAPTIVHAQEGMQMPPPAVGVLELTAKSVPVVNELPGRIAATRTAEVRARVSGILLERVFEQGTLVQKDDVLYRIDPRLFKVRVASAEASLQRAQATQSNARQQLERQKNLRERNVSTGIDYDTAAVNLAQADADVALQQAALDEARINLDYTEVRAPISGIIGGALVTEGALVTADGTQNLALIQQIDPSYADFTQSAQDMMSLRRAVDDGKLASPAPGQASVRLVFDDGSVYPDAGRLLFASASVDSTTGQVTLRAEFPNARRDLLPGMYVRVRIEQAVRENAVTVPQRSIIRNADGKPLVYVVNGDTAEARPIELGQALETEWVVEKGLTAGDKVVVDGAQKVQPGGKIKPEPWQPEKTAETPAQAPKQ
ncbi:efflux transporter periplasmic adaptor subunit [Agrobacterium rosae]|uniref:Efflux transporter periplasmic adaptor subunit n=2 Tax=Agrobacterium rosae TaxID=1972867 RepID=A0AAE5VQ38_9HYPH|nr:efflux RND transporter periplasmic adaptor subunit [Agrobacterium rosae]KAA3519204.1 efflux RND transporter periplasmic adaptor subunit [Agrobacterium rosae]MCM2435318.1 efflux RND transporter periplasmic adaptor subunit [Agrobacterium rosae]MQB49168.1 efflux RND transporter periplasmic adaptor subunit [Agrobacterium rosae]POO52005.1 efflux transporter periplasmic adaptor subunit [Agrobacterium rosae]